ncbi:MAG: ABC transporter substrate-binding protein [Rhizobiaceae bacterium]|nr:ABC transporter substrate-binding protein [Rhizobiaceae bacterium]
MTNHRTTIDRRHFLLAGAALMAAGATGARAQAPTPFRIGSLTPITGSGGAYGSGMQKTMKACVDLVNSLGGAGGRMLEFYAEDSQTSPEPAVLAARKLADVNQVDAILGTWSTGETLAVMSSVTQPADIINMNVSGIAAAKIEGKKDFCWRFSPLSGSFGVIYAGICKEMGYKRPVILQFNNGSAEAQAQGFTATSETMGVPVLDKIIYEGDRATYRSELQRALSHQPDVIILAGYSVDSIIILREWYQTGIPAKFIMPSWAADKKLIDALGKDVVEGIEIVGSVVDSEGSAYPAFDKMHQEVMGQPGSANKYAAMCYDMINVLALALEKAGPNATRADVNAAITSVSNEPGTQVASFEEGRDVLKSGGEINYNGASSRVDLNDHDDDSGSIFAWTRIVDGAFEDVKKLSPGKL